MSSCINIDSISPLKSPQFILNNAAALFDIHMAQTTFSLDVVGATTSDTTTGIGGVIGNIANLYLSGCTFLDFSPTLVSTAIPVSLRPVETKYFPTIASDGGSHDVGLATLTPTGIFTFYPVVSGGDWSSGGNIAPFCASYTLV